MLLKSFTQFWILVFATNYCYCALVVNTWDFTNATARAWNVLRRNESALNALVEGCEVCEQEQCDGTVGYGGSPDENGESTLDAMIFDGTTMKAGGVAQLRNCKTAIRVALHVLLYTSHTLLVGSLATDFAQQMGFKIETLSTNSSMMIFNGWKSRNCQPNFWKNVFPEPNTFCGPYKPKHHDSIHTEQKIFTEPSVIFGSRYNHDTIGMIILDNQKNIVAGTSTNGASHKIPGRVGDSSIPGSGAYASNEVGAATCTGDGDILMRFSPALQAVNYLEAGFSPDDAAQKALEKVSKYYQNLFSGIVVVNRTGSIGAACTGMKEFPYSVVTDSSEGVQVLKKKCFIQ